jgi:hypothetical protein
MRQCRRTLLRAGREANALVAGVQALPQYLGITST